MIHLTDWLTTQQIPAVSKITSTIDHHLHDHSFFEFFYVIDGSIGHTLNGTTTFLHTGDAFFLNPEDQHIFLRNPDTICRHRDIIMRKSFFRAVCNFISPEFFANYTENKIQKTIRFSPADVNELEERFSQIASIPSVEIDHIMTRMKTSVVWMLDKLINVKYFPRERYPDWFYSLLERFDDPILIKNGLSDILSPFYFANEHICRVFKKFTGSTMTEYLNMRRLALAADQLVYTNNQIIKIVNDIGFCSVSYFNKIFKEKYGSSPHEFRNHNTTF